MITGQWWPPWCTFGGLGRRCSFSTLATIQDIISVCVLSSV